jgi:type III restriction enzyme
MAFRKQAKIVVTNFHAFQLREKVKAGELTMELLAQGEASPFAVISCTWR